MATEPTQTLGGSPAQASPGGSSFAPDDLLAGRYRIVRFIAAGGMGEVYEAEDLELDVRIALKTVRPAVAARAGSAQLLREIQLARKITDPHVCRTFDIGKHGDVPFLTMELLAGETLAARLLRSGPLPVRDARRLALDLAAALAAAHRAGVIHRDFKSGNVMLTDRGAVVTDFGLAAEAALPGEHGGAGTRAYMAPEQVAGGTVVPASDVYALGVVVHEALTGERPVPEVRRTPRPFRGIIEACLRHDPARRPPPQAIAAALTSGRRRTVAAVLVAGVLGAAAVRIALPAGGSRPAGPRRAVAVVGFTDPSGRADRAWAATAVAERLATELGAGETLRIVPGDTVARARLDLGVGDNLDAGTLARLRAYLGADIVAYGEYSGGGDRWHVDVGLVDAGGAGELARVGETGTDLADVVHRLGTELRSRLAVPEPGGDWPPPYRESPEAARHYSEGLAALRRFEPLAARDALALAVAADPKFGLAHAALAEAWQELGYGGRAADEAKRAVDRSDGLPRAERLLIEGLYYDVTEAHEQAVDVYRTLVRFFPDDLEHGLRLARAQVAGGHPEAALVTLAALRALPPPRGDDPRIDLAVANAAWEAGDPPRRLAAATAAVSRGRARGARLTVATAELELGWARYFTGDRAGATAAFDDAFQLARDLGARKLESQLLIGQGELRNSSGDIEGARPLYEESLRIRREIGDEHGLVDALTELTYQDAEAARFLDARRRGEEAIAVAERIGDPSGFARFNLGLALFYLGDLAGARRRHVEALDDFERRGNVVGAARARLGIAMVDAARGELAAAETALRAMLPIWKAEARPFATFPLDLLASVRASRGDLAEAHALAEESRQIGEEMQQTRTQPRNLVFRARLALAEGNTAEAAERASAAAAMFTDQHAPERASWALTYVARALARSDHAAALAAVRRAEELGGGSQSVFIRLAISEAIAAVAEGGGRAERARGRAAAARAAEEAERAGLVDQMLDSRLLLGRLEALDGRGRARLDAVRADAEARGYVLIAREARGARRP